MVIVQNCQMNNIVFFLIVGISITSALQPQDEFTWSEIKSPLRELVKARNDDLIPITGKIVGGSLATQFQFPHQAAIVIKRSDENAFCGGSIIASKLILTAALCLKG